MTNHPSYHIRRLQWHHLSVASEQRIKRQHFGCRVVFEGMAEQGIPGPNAIREWRVIKDHLESFPFPTGRDFGAGGYRGIEQSKSDRDTYRLYEVRLQGLFERN